MLNEFFNKLMRSERKQEIAKAKLKKVRQQLNTQPNLNQTQTWGNAPPNPLTPPTPAPATPPTANVPRKAQVGRPTKVTKPRTTQPTSVGDQRKSLHQNHH